MSIARSACSFHAFAVVLVTVVLACAGPEGRLDEMRLLQEAGEYEETIAPLRAILASDPGHAEASMLLGTALAHTNRQSLAIPYLERATKAPDLATDAGMLLASTLQATQNPEQAMSVLEELLKREPEHMGALALHAHAALAAKKPELALAGADRILALDPASYQGLSLRAVSLGEMGRVDDAEQAYRALADLSSDEGPGLALRGCMSLARFQGVLREDVETALVEVQKCLDRFPDEPLATQLAMGLYDEIDRPDRTLELLRESLEAQPEALQLRGAVADRLIAAGEEEEALQLLEEGATTFGQPGAWLGVARMQRSRGELAAARDAIDHALELAPESEDLLFEKAALLIELGDLEGADVVAGGLGEEAYSTLLLGRAALARGEPRLALEQIERSLVLWPNNGAARESAARAALELGDYDRAASELREAARLETPDAKLHLARIELQRGNFNDALAFAGQYAKARPDEAGEAYLIVARAASQLGYESQVEEALDALSEKPAYAAIALAERASMVRRRDGVEAALRVFEESNVDLADPQNVLALDAYFDLALGSGRVDAAERAAARARANTPDAVHPLVLSARVQLAKGDLDGARGSLERALEIGPDDAEALLARAELALSEGDAERATDLIQRVGTFEEAPLAFRTSQILAASGDAVGAEAALRETLRLNPEHAGAANDLAYLLAEQGEDLDTALAMARRASRVLAVPEVLDTLGWVHFKRGEFDEAAAVFERAVGQSPDFSTGYYHLGLTQVKRGEQEAARVAFERALAGDSFAEADAARSELAALGGSQ